MFCNFLKFGYFVEITFVFKILLHLSQELNIEQNLITKNYLFSVGQRYKDFFLLIKMSKCLHVLLFYCYFVENIFSTRLGTNLT